MTQEDKELLLKDLCTRLSYRVKIFIPEYDESQVLCGIDADKILFGTETVGIVRKIFWSDDRLHIKPYLRPMSSMTEKEAMEVAELWGLEDILEDILSVSVKENYISVELDDGVAGSETYIIWFNEIVTSIKIFDWLNSHHFDYRGLIGRNLALEAPEKMYYVGQE